jgi:hypothetical protein
MIMMIGDDHIKDSDLFVYNFFIYKSIVQKTFLHYI